jgi:DNA-binding transcriptional MerR regulator
MSKSLASKRASGGFPAAGETDAPNKRTGSPGSGPSRATASSPQRVDSRELYRTKDVVQILGISRRQLQYWAQTDLVVPSQRTQGGHHRYSFEDLVALKAAKRLIDAGVSVQRIRRAIRSLREILPTIEKPLTELVLVATGDVVLAFVEGTVFEAVSGQEWVFEVAQFQRQIEAWRCTTQSEESRRATTGPVRAARSARRPQERSQTA